VHIFNILNYTINKRNTITQRTPEKLMNKRAIGEKRALIFSEGTYHH
jgi:hypothetical protein